MQIGFFVFPEFQILDLTGPLSVFDMAQRLTSGAAYDLRVLSLDGGAIRSSCGLVVETERWSDRALDTLIVVGGNGSRAAARCERILAAVSAGAANSRRVGSVCTGTFVLAAAGLLAGRRATTHWRHAAELRRCFPAVRVEADRIFVCDGNVWSSAGITAGIDLALALVETDLGVSVSRAVAGELVVYHRRSGGQSQFSALSEMTPASDRIRVTLEYARAHLAADLSVERLAAVAALSPRQFTRRFRAETGTTPARAVERLRVESARRALESGGPSIAHVARQTGFGDAERMRRAFIRLLGQPPQALRRAARAPHEISA